MGDQSLFGSVPTSMIDVLSWRAELEPDRIAYVFLVDGEVNEVSVTYGELDRQAKCIAAMLQKNHLVGDRCLLIYPPGLEFLAAFFGCLYAGVVAVPVYPPRKDKDMVRILAVLNNSGCSSVMTISSILERFEKVKADFSIAELEQLHWLVSDQTEELRSLETKWQHPEIEGNHLAFLQYTSGSTGLPKGVMVSHGNLIYNQRMLTPSTAHTRDCILVTWLPLYHDMGLIGNIMHPLYIGFKCIFMSPEAFLQKPFRWLDAISRHKATTTGGAPNFAFDFCIHRITPEQREQLDLSSWKFALVGSDTVRHKTLERFIEAFGPYGFRRETFYPAFGLAEATLIVSGGKKEAAPNYFSVDWDALTRHQVKPALPGKKHQVLVGCGQTMLDQKIKIVDPYSLRECAPDKIGEIWVSGKNVSQGYWDNEEQTNKLLKARIKGNQDEAFLRTGDLGFLREGELYITGRVKNLIVIRGRNHYPHDIEATVEASVKALRAGCSAAFTIEEKGEEKLVVVAELERRFLSERRRLGSDGIALDSRQRSERRQFNANDRGISQPDPDMVLDECIDSIRQAVAENHGLQTHAIVLIRPVSLPKTTSGKIRRLDCRKQFLDNKLIVIKEWVDKPVKSVLAEKAKDKQIHNTEAIESWLLSRLAQEFKLARHQINPGIELFRYGLDSLAAVGISGELEEWLGKAVSPTVFYNFPTIRSIAKHLSGDTLPIGLYNMGRSDQLELNTPIAIVGAACRFPGANNLSEFWELLQNSVDAITEVPPDRWDIESYFDAEKKQPGKMNTRWGGFLDKIDHFDPLFFGISPREAIFMDPQQRILLEVSWEAFENAGINVEDLVNSNTGVFIGISNNEYSRLTLDSNEQENAYQGIGGALSIAANRISYQYDFRGPSIAVDTACSSSLVSVHMACQSLRTGESELAIAGGVNLLLTPEPTVVFSQADMMASDGRCKTFDAAADGYVRSEGCGLVVLKLLPDAIASGDSILAVVKGSAINQDGRSNGITAPNGPSQQAVITNALRNAGIKTSQVNYIEAHGTGTSLGDPIEVDSLKAVLMQDRPVNKTCFLGSVKTNIGHLESAAGIAGLLKATLAIHHGEIPSNLHFNSLNPHITLEDTSFKIPVSSQSWPGDSQPRIAGINSFGFGGTNAHMIVGSQDRIAEDCTIGFSKQLFTLSAKSEQSLHHLIIRHLAFLEQTDPNSFINYCYSVNQGRAHFDHRIAIPSDSISQLVEHLKVLSTQKVDKPLKPVLQQDQIPRIVFTFPGHSAFNANLGSSLYRLHPVFAAGIDQCDDLTGQVINQSLVSLISEKRSDNDFSHLIAFAIEYSLAKLWVSWGIVPDVLVGSGIGEIVAATLADIFDLDLGLKLAALYDGKGNIEFADFYTQSPTLPVLSGNSGEDPLKHGGKDLDYWQKRTENTAAKITKSLEDQGYRFSIMMGPCDVSKSNDRDTGGLLCLPSLSDDKGDWDQLLDTLGDLYMSGVNVNWLGFYDKFKGLEKIDLPNYPFRKKSYWIDDRKNRETSTVKIDQHQYEIKWKAANSDSETKLPGSAAKKGGFWLIFADNEGVGSNISLFLKRQEQNAVLVYSGNNYSQIAPDHFEISHSNSDHYDRLLNETGSKLGPCQGIIHLWSLNESGSPEVETMSLVSTIKSSSLNVLYLMQSISRCNQLPTKGLWFATYNAHAFKTKSPQQISIAQRVLWGLGKGIALEFSDVDLGLIDLDKASPEINSALICRELALSPKEWQVAYRNGNRYVARLVPAKHQENTKQQSKKIKNDATYLITGGLGKIGLSLANFLVEKGARHIALVSRTGLPDPSSRAEHQELAAQLIQDLETKGINIKSYKADVSDFGKMKKVLEEIQATQAAVKGVFHAAGSVSKSTISGITEEEFLDVLKPKVEGTCVLHRLSLSMDLDYFVLFSSVSSVWGSREIAHYAAANSFLDGFAEYRKALQLPVTSINWGPWAEGGMTSTEEQLKMSRMGIYSMNPESSLKILDKALSLDFFTQIVASIDWHRFVSLYQSIGYGSLFSELPVSPKSSNTGGSMMTTEQAANQGKWLNKLLALNDKEKAAELLELIKTEIAKILQCQPADINIDTGFIDLGLDSLMAVELKDTLEQQLNLTLDATIVFDYPNLNTLTKHLISLLDSEQSHPEKTTVKPELINSHQTNDSHSDLDDLTDDEVAKLIEKEIEDI